MTTQPTPSATTRVLYRVDLDDPSSAIVGDALPPSTAVIDAPPPTPESRLEGEPIFRIDHALYDAEQRAAWVADELLQPGSVFHGRVHVPTTKGGKKAARLKASPTQLTQATFTSIIGQMLHQSAYVQQICLPDELIAGAVLEGPNSLTHQKVEQGGQLLARLFLHYWRAVATAFPEAWDDPHDYLLWHPHGMTALAQLGAHVVQDQVAAYDIRQHYFDEVLERIAGSVSLAKVDHVHVPLRQLSSHLFQLLASARHTKNLRRPGLMAVPGGVSDINWGSAAPPVSPDVSSVPLGAEN
ncbi:hypothetical protein [Microcella sp.]|uniref:hypothetical protein n=1 Tax=Microcella sp. TaxID=1913979 RepID=UPI00391B0C8C